ncbi:glycoside hydrolase family 3 C-terminal domain-containing protein [uncultured Bacteroides sp.]|uniref:glycoside hydrolase family 3 C-terminal domain-containing protein n=1 Tax=uncultured Bacteroides sp. TaxID=162156 RepID=UPI0025FCCBCC|nr:glycoside hydrolase family 3 C-terminal domain-containing protein [uncultured Bacteroides sp.]
MKINTLIGIVLMLLASTSCTFRGNDWSSCSGNKLIEARVDSVLALMTLEEKIGQLTQCSIKSDTMIEVLTEVDMGSLLKGGLTGSFFNVTSSDIILKIQEKLLAESRLKIPALFALDVMQGFETMFPFPLAESCCWDPELTQRNAAIAAAEASSVGINWTTVSAPDICSGHRGQLMGGYGEETYLDSLLSAARLRGFQGEKVEDLLCLDKILAYNKCFAIEELISDGILKDETQIGELLQSAKEGTVDEAVIDNAVRRILEIKFLLGIMDDPYRYLDREREQSTLMKPEFLEAARDAGRKSMVLLKNDRNFFPISTSECKTIALIGPMVKESRSLNASWAVHESSKQCISFFEGMETKYKNSNVRFLYAEGCTLEEMEKTDFAHAVAVARQADMILVAAGEHAGWGIESGCSTNVALLPASQRNLLKELKKLDKPLGLILMNGRPLELSWENENVDAILEVWYPGSMGGHAVADIVSGDYNPSGKLTMSFSLAGQRPLYPFGYGLSYTVFEVNNLKINKKELKKKDTLTATVDVANLGKYDGEEVVQLYISEFMDSTACPVKKLKGFHKVFLKIGETKTLTFCLTGADLGLGYGDVQIETKPRTFHLWVGTSSTDERNVTEFILK